MTDIAKPAIRTAPATDAWTLARRYGVWVALALLFAVAGITLAPDNVLSDIWQVPVAQVAPIIPYLLLVLILIFRPTGLLGTRDT